MLRYLLTRLFSLTASLLAASLIIFLALEVVPGDPAAFMLGLEASEETVAALRAQLGLEAPAPQRYIDWLTGLAQGEFGISYTYKVPVGELIADRIWISVPLALYALILSLLIAFPVGILAASRRGGAADVAVMGVTQLGVAIPNFWIAILLVLAFALTWRVFPPGGFPGWEDPLAALYALTLPAVSLALLQASVLARIMRSALLDTLDEDYIRTARAKGLSRAQALWRHALRNAMIPVLTIIGLQCSFLLAGGIIVETIFYLPGLGRLLFQGIAQRDLIVVKNVALLLVAAVVFINFLVDIGYASIDPRLRRR